MDISQTLFEWVRANANADPAALRLKYAGKQGNLDFNEAIIQIECKVSSTHCKE